MAPNPTEVARRLLTLCDGELRFGRAAFWPTAEVAAGSMHIDGGVLDDAPLPHHLANWIRLLDASASGEPIHGLATDLCTPVIDVRGSWYVAVGLVADGRRLAILYADGPPSGEPTSDLLDCMRITARFAAAGLRMASVTVQLRDQAHRDALTGLPNRRALEERARAILTARPIGTQSALILVDIDDFKTLNDKNGHLFGDGVIQSVATTLAMAARNGDFVARYGGDEFIVLLDRLAPGEARHSVRRFSAALRSARLRCSLGIAVFPSGGATLAELLAAADRALYAVKAAGKNGFAFA
ncbi:MAG: GGDEF domain-containing protein [Candidatus Eremiobacteraeota bacterium]|nr:GGDEF domain-containing protein [Candidatus Eremiobacteraeota bacterium]